MYAGRWEWNAGTQRESANVWNEIQRNLFRNRNLLRRATVNYDSDKRLLENGLQMSEKMRKQEKKNVEEMFWLKRITTTNVVFACHERQPLQIADYISDENRTPQRQRWRLGDGTPWLPSPLTNNKSTCFNFRCPMDVSFQDPAAHHGDSNIEPRHPFWKLFDKTICRQCTQYAAE